jgi:hypothetical protein
MEDKPHESPGDNNPGTPIPAGPLAKLTRAQVFARDPEEMSPQDIAFVIEELTKINLRNRKARKDEEALTQGIAKIKKANVAAKKKKSTAALPADILEAKL